MKLKFKVLSNHSKFPKAGEMQGFLLEDNWNDWFKYSTMYYLIVFDNAGVLHDLGRVKIGQANMVTARPAIPEEFTTLEADFFSIGQSADYYETLYQIDEDLRYNILRSLGDLVWDEVKYEKHVSDEVIKESLLRSVSPKSVKGQFKRLLYGSKRLTKFKFEYELASGSRVAGVHADFHVSPDSNPPTNIHVLIGRNGVGKTHLLNNMTRCLVSNEENEAKHGVFNSLGDDSEALFSGVVSVSFSAFDPFDPLPEQRDKTAGIKYSYVGLKRTTNRGGEKGTPMSHDMLAAEFYRSLNTCFSNGGRTQWLTSLETLETDRLFKDAELSSLALEKDATELKKRAVSVFKKLSSGHGVVLLTLTKLINYIEEKTLVFLDEPEAHLHPPLLSAFIRALSDLLVHRNAVAIVATHSPVILQEVPKKCVWKITRSGYEASLSRPRMETFGENVGVLTREVFGLEVTKSGFHKLLEEHSLSAEDYDDLVDRFGGQLGAEARAIARAIMLDREDDL